MAKPTFNLPGGSPDRVKHKKRTGVPKEGSWESDYHWSEKSGKWVKTPTTRQMTPNEVARVIGTSEEFPTLNGEDEAWDNKQIYNKLRGQVPQVLVRLNELLHDENPKIRLDAAKLILSKILPDLKAVEVSSNDSLKSLVIVRHTGDTVEGEVTVDADLLAEHIAAQEIAEGEVDDGELEDGDVEG